MRFTPTLMLGDWTIATFAAAFRIRSIWAGPSPVLPMTIGFPAAAAAPALRAEESAPVKSIATSAAATAFAKSSVTGTPALPAPAASKASCESRGCPAASTAPERENPWGASFRMPRIALPIRPIAPQTTTQGKAAHLHTLQVGEDLREDLPIGVGHPAQREPELFADLPHHGKRRLGGDRVRLDEERLHQGPQAEVDLPRSRHLSNGEGVVEVGHLPRGHVGDDGDDPLGA